METFPIIINVVVLLALVVFVWKRLGPKSGRAYGNRIAAHLGIPRKTFWYLMENGTAGSALDVLAPMEKSGLSLNQAGIKLGPTLQKGLDRLEARFGAQEMYDEAKPVIAKLLAASEQKA